MSQQETSKSTLWTNIQSFTWQKKYTHVLHQPSTINSVIVVRALVIDMMILSVG